MIAFAFVDDHGIPTGGGIRRTLPEGAVTLPPPWTTLDLPRLQWRGGAWVPREARPAPVRDPKAEAAARLDQARAEGLRRVTA